ncbi:unnamed protein product [Caretta caretta]
MEGLMVNLVNIFGQTSPKRPQFYQRVSDFLGTLDSHECLVLGEDFNTTLEEQDRSGPEPSPAATNILQGIAHSSTIRPVPFSDHHLATITVSLHAERPGPAYWHFNNSLLEDESFVTSFQKFWLAWREQWRAFPSVRRWWDLGKVRAKLFCRDYTRGTSRRRNAAIEQLEREVLEMERCLAANPEDPSLCGACWEKREELRALKDHRARGAFVRSRIRLLREMDRGSCFFYALEKTRRAKKHVTCLLAEDGTPLTDPEEMCGRARDFYTSLSSPDPTDPGTCGVLWEEFPTVSVGDRDRLELPLTLAEFSEALRRMPTNKSPGMDGLTVEFYRAFWDILGPDLVTVWAESLHSGVLPLSCRRAVLVLLPKKGDFRDLLNWRPVSLLSTDYKIVAKAISLRLGSVMADMIHPDQTYTVPGRSIFDNLFLVRDLLELGRRDGLSFALLSLDQEKAFDRVDHGYLLSTLQAFGFGPQFVSFLRVLYTSAEYLVRLNWTLTEPVSFGRGVRQGCPLSGQLYALRAFPLSPPQEVDRASAFLSTLDSRECLVLGGDLNTTLEKQDHLGTKQSPATTDTLWEIVEHHSLGDIWCDHHPDDTSTFTFVRVKAHWSSQSRLEHIYLSCFHLSRAHSSSIRLVPFSDHHLATVTASLCAERPRPAYWHFNNSLLEDEGFVMSFQEFWLAWRGQRCAFPSARRWWDLGKMRARLFCCDYTRGTSRRRHAAIEQSEWEVLELERHLAAGPEDPLLCGVCREKREDLRALEDHRAWGAFVRSRIRLLQEMDRASHFFYALEKTRGAKKHVTCLLAEDGTPLTEPAEMCERARAFYASLFSPDSTDPSACRVLWEELPTVSSSDRDRLELPVILAKFSEALSRMPTNKSPGMDGLTVEFYHVTDYKIVAKAISLWLGSVLADVIHPDQTYTVLDRSIFDNLFMVQDLVELRRRDSLSFSLLSLDQEKAFDRVDHWYLLSTLQAFGFGPQFVGFLRVLYTSAECLVKLNWTLTEPVSFRRLTGLVLRERELQLVLLAYADDVLLVIQDPGDLVRVEACQAIYSVTSSAQVNWVKSSGLANENLDCYKTLTGPEGD